MAIDRLIDLIEEKNNPTILGLDPQPEYIPPDIFKKHTAWHGETLAGLAAAYKEVLFELIDGLCALVPAVKPQLAFYEALGPSGISLFSEVVEFAKSRNLFVLADAKRGDIGSTSAAYSAAFLGRTTVGGAEFPVYDADGLTVNPYLGSDNLNPFLLDCKKYDKMVFVLCKTSNPSAGEVQELLADGRPLYHHIAEQVSAAGSHLKGDYGYLKTAIVAGATQPDAISFLRSKHPELFFLVPGYGAQGGKAADLASAFDKHGRGAIINNSRGICCAWRKTPSANYIDAARTAALDMKSDLANII